MVGQSASSTTTAKPGIIGKAHRTQGHQASCFDDQKLSWKAKNLTNSMCCMANLSFILQQQNLYTPARMSQTLTLSWETTFWKSHNMMQYFIRPWLNFERCKNLKHIFSVIRFRIPRILDPVALWCISKSGQVSEQKIWSVASFTRTEVTTFGAQQPVRVARIGIGPQSWAARNRGTWERLIGRVLSWPNGRGLPNWRGWDAPTPPRVRLQESTKS